MEAAQRVAESYSRLCNLKLVGAEVGIPWQQVYVILRRNGIPVIGDKARYGSDKDKLAVMAEREFQILVPCAINQNQFKFQAKVDFMVGNLKIDVKASNANKGMKDRPGLRWAFSLKKQEIEADFFVCFGFHDSGYRTFLLPTEITRKYQSIAIGQTNRSKWLEYEVNPKDLEKFFYDLSETPGVAPSAAASAGTLFDSCAAPLH